MVGYPGWISAVGVDIAAILGSNDMLVVWEFNLGDGFSILLAPARNHDTRGLRVSTRDDADDV